MHKHYQLFTSTVERQGFAPVACRTRHRNGNTWPHAHPRSAAPRMASLLPLAGTWDSVSDVRRLSDDDR
jgi:hypothetical protein